MPLPLRRCTFVCSAALLGGLACSDSPGFTTPALCTGPVTVTVGSGTQPTVNWEPDCAVTSILLLDADSEVLTVPVWSVMAPHGIGPPIRIGTRPAGASVFGAGAVLDVGESYTVGVSTFGRGDPEAGTGSLTFTVQP